MAWIGLGSNLGDSEAILRAAAQSLRGLSPQPLLVSSLWRTEPVDCPPDSPCFLNAVAGLAPDRAATPDTLLEQLQAMEQAAGRRPKRRLNEPRPLDLDLLAFGSERRRTERLVLPHPRAHTRRFVLEPLTEIAPGLILPGFHESVSELLAALKTGEIAVRIKSDWAGPG